MIFNIIISTWLIICVWRVIRLENKLLEISDRNLISLMANMALVKLLKDKKLIEDNELEAEIKIK